MGVDESTDEVTDFDEGYNPIDDSAIGRDPHLLLYDSIRAEIRMRITTHHRSLLSGLSVIGLIIAYALLSGEFVFLAVIPLVIAFLVVQTTRILNHLLGAGRYLSQIEQEYIEDYPLFAWESRRGMVGTDTGIRRMGINWSNVPQILILAFAAFGYFASIYVAYVVWPPEGVDIFLIGLSRGVLLVIYSLLTVLVGFAGYSYYLHQNELEYSNSE